CVRVLVEVAQRVEHLPWLLRRRGRVEEGDRLAVAQLLEVGKVGPDALRIEPRFRRDGHEFIVAAGSQPGLRPPLTLLLQTRGVEASRRHSALLALAFLAAGCSAQHAPGRTVRLETRRPQK